MDTTNCPVCGMPVEITSDTPKSSYDGETYYFCGKGCKLDFEERARNAKQGNLGVVRVSDHRALDVA